MLLMSIWIDYVIEPYQRLETMMLSWLETNFFETKILIASSKKNERLAPDLY